MTPRRPGALVAGLLVLAIAGCEGFPRDEAPPRLPEESSSPAIRPGREPDALMIRFQETRGKGFSREGWEIEVLQMGSDVRIRGSVRTGAQVVPIYQPMDGVEYAAFWRWLRELPLDGHQVRIDPDSTEAPWKKRLEIDVVLGPSDRWLSQNTWTRPLAADDPVRAVEIRLHNLALDIAESEVARMQQEAAADPGSASGESRYAVDDKAGPGPDGNPRSLDAE